MNIAINGFGRIGRTLLRTLTGRPGINLVAVNDLAPAETLAHLVKYDSVHRGFRGKVSVSGDGLLVDGHEIKVLSEKDPANLPLAKDIARYVFIALVLAFLWFRFVRPLLKPAIKKFDEAVAIPPEPEPEEPEPEPEPDPEEEARIQREEEEHQKVQVYKSNLEMAKDMAKNDPRIVANVIKEWLGTE